MLLHYGCFSISAGYIACRSLRWGHQWLTAVILLVWNSSLDIFWTEREKIEPGSYLSYQNPSRSLKQMPNADCVKYYFLISLFPSLHNFYWLCNTLLDAFMLYFSIHQMTIVLYCIVLQCILEMCLYFWFKKMIDWLIDWLIDFTCTV